ncbi:MAG TPA: efflux RND transporter periplasmic adaptor subunit [Candidatus Paceibacterota bacterium]|nr:efflux RND transporter periplasmic adaptor subunit [Candidatus Paceibacterota bacterium]HRU36001.1 efflux RND transporter periplasmic adaptor subunit [Candidatus Paceibacterota bacterium]
MSKKNKNVIVAIKNFIKKNKIASIVIGIIIIALLYLILKPIFSKENEIPYVTAKVERGDITTTVSVTGQITSSNSIDIKPKVSGDISYINLKNGQIVKEGDILLKIDDLDALNSVKDARIALANAKDDLAKMEGLSTDEGMIEATKVKREKDLASAYEAVVDGLPEIFTSTTPSIVENLHDLLFGDEIDYPNYNVDYYGESLMLYNKSSIDYSKTTKEAYEMAKKSYDKALNYYQSKNLTYFSDPLEIEQTLNLTYDAIKKINDSVRASLNLVRLYKDSVNNIKLEYPKQVDDHDKILTSYFTITNNLFSKIDLLKNNVQTAKENLVDVNFDLQDQRNTVEKAQRNLQTALNKLADYTIKAPFDGILGNVDDSIFVGDNISSNTVLGVLTSKQYIIKISLSEDDAAKVKVGQKALITFDVLDNLQATGKIIDVDVVGKISQGVVSYDAKVLLDDNIDERVKSGMSTTIDIITQTKSNVLTIPRIALKMQNNKYYVEILNDKKEIEKRPVEIGLQADSKVEIIKGLNEGEKVIVSGNAINNSSTTNSKNFNQINNQRRLPAGGMF